MQERQRPSAPFFSKFLLWILLALLYVPIFTLIAASFAGESGVTLHWYEEVFADGVLWQALRNSLWVAALSSLGATFLGTLAALALHRSGRRLRAILEGLSSVSLVFPEIVFALALLSWFFLLQWGLGLTTVIFAHISFSISYVMMAVSARLAHFEDSLEEAARDLGASEGTILRTVVLPLIRPAVLAGLVLSFLLSFDDFLITFFVNGADSDTLPVKLYTSMKIGLTPKLHALATLMFVFSCFSLLALRKSKIGFSLWGAKSD